MKSSSLAIIIPAYKSDYLEATLQSLVAQTNQDFTVYIGDDCSPNQLKTIVDKYSQQLNIVYKFFTDNLGASSLIKQWERCIDMSHEPWVWLFSDDDMASPNCVATFYANLKETSKLYKFNTKIIDADGNYTWQKYDDNNAFSPIIKAQDFINQRLSCQGFRSFAVEYIFHRSLYQVHKFKEFPLAWASDDATWFCYALANKAIITGLDAEVQWRWSGSNISSSVKNKDINTKKINASWQYALWLRDYAKQQNISIDDALILKWFSIQVASVEYPINYAQYKLLIKKIKLDLSTWLSLKHYMIIKYYHVRNKLN